MYRDWNRKKDKSQNMNAYQNTNKTNRIVEKTSHINKTNNTHATITKKNNQKYEDEVGEDRDCDIGEAQERIGERQLHLGENEQVRRHRDDEGREACENPRVEDDLEDPCYRGFSGEAERSERHHALLEHELAPCPLRTSSKTWSCCPEVSFE